MKSRIAKAIRSALLEDKRTQTEIAALVGCKQPFVSEVKKGSKSPGEFTIRFCQVLGIDPGSGGPRAADDSVEQIPLLGEVSAGSPTDPGESVSIEVRGHEDLVFPVGLWSFLFPGVRPQGLAALRVSGSSMAPHHNDGDLVFVRRTEDREAVRDGQQVVLYLPGEGYTLKVWRDAGILESLNRAFAPRLCPKGARLWGVYVCGTRMG